MCSSFVRSFVCLLFVFTAYMSVYLSIFGLSNCLFLQAESNCLMMLCVSDVKRTENSRALVWVFRI